jgi:drug/metabolite transporter (DMT)-like permease
MQFVYETERFLVRSTILPGASAGSSSALSRRTFSWLMLIVANILWSTSYVASKVALRDTSVTMLLVLRISISALVFLPLLIVQRNTLHLTRKDLSQLVFLALIGCVVNKLLEFGGLNLATASDVALLITGESIFTTMLSWMLLHERFRKRSIVALFIGFSGVYLIVERSLLPNIPSGGGVLRIVGDLLVIMALLIEAFYTVRSKRLLVKHSPLLVTSAPVVVSTLFWIPVGGWEVLSTGWQMPSLFSWLCIGWLALMCTVLAYLCWFQGLMRVDGSAAASTLFIQPLLGTILAILFLHDELTFTTILGGILIIVSVYLISRQ